MGTNTNIGETTALTVYGNPKSFKKLISSHGVLCKVKQALACPSCASNHGSPSIHCDICEGDGYIYTYQRRFLVADEESKSIKNKVYPFYNPILSVEKVQTVTSEVQGGITNLVVSSFTDTEITVSEDIIEYEKKRVTYTFDGWTYVANEKLVTDATNGLMYADGTIYNSAYQSSNPLNAFADIAKIDKIWNIDTDVEITDYTVEGKTISTSQPIVNDKMYINYYYSDLTKVIPTDLNTKNNNEVFTQELLSGECKMAFYPFVDLSRGDIIVMAAIILWKNETLPHLKDLDKLFEMEIFELNNVILDENGVEYYIDTDYILQGRHIKWISTNKPKVNTTISIRYGYKPSYIIYEDNPQPNNLENKLYPTLVMAKAWSKVNKDEIASLINN